MDGRDSILEEVRLKGPTDVADFLRLSIRRLLASRDFVEALEGHLPPGVRTESRLLRLIGRLKRLRDE